MRDSVDKVLRCECGFEARAADEDGLAAKIQRHAQEVHGMTLSRNEALLLTFRADLARIRVVESSPFGKEKP